MRAQPRLVSISMSESHWSPWVRVVLVVGGVYGCVGIVFAGPTDHVKAWRLAAWLVCAITYAAHICYEHFRLRNSAPSAALHVALAVALGAFFLALGANINSLSRPSTGEHQRLLLLAFGLWPVITGLPAFLVALCASWILANASSGTEVK